MNTLSHDYLIDHFLMNQDGVGPGILLEKKTTVAQDIIAGGVAGSISVLVGHPFDTIKVRLQSSSSATIAGIFSSGWISLFRGMGPPLSTAALLDAIIFAAYGTSSRVWDRYAPLGLQSAGYKTFVCGAVAGACQAVIICPIDQLKCKLQICGNGYHGPNHVCQEIFRSHGYSGLYRGLHATLAREIPSFAIYFSVYEYVKGFINDQIRFGKDGSVNKNIWISSVIGGGVSGCLSWACIYPLDVIKTRIQTAPMRVKASDLGVITVGRNLVRDYGWKILFRGVDITLLRAFPTNCIIFPVYEFALSQLKAMDH
jgi:Mitochondrial carrier protein